jgi:hypothetical protein
MSKSSLLKNARNYAEYLRKKERGPVKAFFHITKNENVPAIEQQGLLTNHPNANINSANHPFRKHGTDAGGVWVTTEPTAFPVYGTTIGGKNGNAAARADALSTIKIEVPLPELRKMRAVQDPYGKNILRKGDDSRAVESFGTWAGIDVPTTVFLDDIKPVWLKNLGYVEDMVSTTDIAARPTMTDLAGTWDIRPDNKDFRFFNDIDFKILRSLNKGDLRDYAGYTGHRHGAGGYEKSPQRFVEDYINRNRPITDRLPVFPVAAHPNRLGRLQGAIIRDDETNALKRFGNQPLAFDWSDEYRDYVKPGDSPDKPRQFKFVPGAISRGMGGAHMPSIKERNFNWNKYKKLLAEGDTPQAATFAAQPNVKLDWDNIVYRNGAYRPQTVSAHEFDAINEGTISRGTPYNMKSSARMARTNRVAASIALKNAKADAATYLTSQLGRQPTAEEIDNWARIGLVNKIEAGDVDVPSIAADWAWKYNEDIVHRLTHELGGD